MTPPRLKLKRLPDLIAAVPYVLGFHPSDSAVVVALRRRILHFVLRFDLRGAEPEHVVRLITEHRPDRVVVLGYGDAPQVTAVLPALAAGLRLAGVVVLDEVRIADGKYWSLDGADAQPCVLDSSVVAASATFQGLPVLPDRAALVAQLAPITGAERAAMTTATTGIEARLSRWVGVDPLPEAGLDAVRAAQAGRHLTDDDVALLGVVLQDRRVSDFAWDRSRPRAAEQVLWMDVVRRVEPFYVPAPATLLAFVAWRLGLGPLAGVAIDRALTEDPGYEPARLMDAVLRRGIDPAGLEALAGRRAA